MIVNFNRVLRYFGVFILVLLVASCGNEPDVAQPEGLIEENQMVQILKEMQLVEARYQRRLFEPRDKIKEKTLAQYAKLLADHNITEEQFIRSYDYYKKNPEQLTAMYERVIEELATEQAELQKELTEDRKEQLEQRKANAASKKPKQRVPPTDEAE